MNVRKGIRKLADLTKSPLRVAIANPDVVFVCMLTVEIAEKNLTPEQIKRLKMVL